MLHDTSIVTPNAAEISESSPCRLDCHRQAAGVLCSWKIPHAGVLDSVLSLRGEDTVEHHEAELCGGRTSRYRDAPWLFGSQPYDCSDGRQSCEQVFGLALTKRLIALHCYIFTIGILPGSVTTTRLPSPFAEVSSIVPPRVLTRSLVIPRPIPRPGRFSSPPSPFSSRAACSALIPGPVSVM
jgi:hypothetical protein